MNNIQPLMWRKGLVLSATFLCGIFLIVACKKKVNPLGQSAIDQSELLNSGGIDTFSITTFSYLDTTIISDNAPFGVLGSYNDPVFGTFNSEIYTQFRMEGLNPNFGVLSSITVDSFVLALEYIGYYGDAGIQNFEVNEITEDFYLDSTYKSSKTLLTNPSNLIFPGMEMIDMDATSLTVVGQDTVDSQLRIHLSTSKAKNMLIEATSGSGSFVDNDAFQAYFKGLRIKTVDAPAPGQGGVFYFNMSDPASKLTLYYTQGGVQKTFDFLINSSCADFNHVDIDNTSTQVQTVLTDTSSGQVEYYAQAFGCRAVVEIPGIDNIPSNAVIHKASLELPIQYQTSTNYAPGLDISVSTILDGDLEVLYGIGTGAYSDFSKSFKIDLRGYIQAVVSGEIENTGLIISPLLHNTTADRIVFNGSQTTNKAKPKFTILYTEF